MVKILTQAENISGLLLVSKEKGIPSFRLVSMLRKIFQVKKIGHAGTLDPFATGVMIMLVGKSYTKLCDQFMGKEKQYLATLKLGETTDTYDSEGVILSSSSHVPSLEQIQASIGLFQGDIMQMPPMYSAKKIGGKRLYSLARQGISIERSPSLIHVAISIKSYSYPNLILDINCSKGTYIRSLAHDIGKSLGCGAYLQELQRTRIGNFKLSECIDSKELFSIADLKSHLQKI